VSSGRRSVAVLIGQQTIPSRPFPDQFLCNIYLLFRYKSVPRHEVQIDRLLGCPRHQQAAMAKEFEHIWMPNRNCSRHGCEWSPQLRYLVIVSFTSFMHHSFMCGRRHTYEGACDCWWSISSMRVWVLFPLFYFVSHRNDMILCSPLYSLVVLSCFHAFELSFTRGVNLSWIHSHRDMKVLSLT
jgi:hypothetical protein